MNYIYNEKLNDDHIILTFIVIITPVILVHYHYYYYLQTRREVRYAVSCVFVLNLSLFYGLLEHDFRAHKNERKQGLIFAILQNLHLIGMLH